jgi:hypothetical protein
MCVRHVSSIKIFWQLLEVYGDGVRRVQHVRKYCRDFDIGGMDICDDNCTGRATIQCEDSMNRELVLENWWVTIMRTWKWIFVNGCECKNQISTAVEF